MPEHRPGCPTKQQTKEGRKEEKRQKERKKQGHAFDQNVAVLSDCPTHGLPAAHSSSQSTHTQVLSNLSISPAGCLQQDLGMVFCRLRLVPFAVWCWLVFFGRPFPLSSLHLSSPRPGLHCILFLAFLALVARTIVILLCWGHPFVVGSTCGRRLHPAFFCRRNHSQCVVKHL